VVADWSGVAMQQTTFHVFITVEEDAEALFVLFMFSVNIVPERILCSFATE